jgi:hypothetical protein
MICRTIESWLEDIEDIEDIEDRRPGGTACIADLVEEEEELD